MIGVSNSSKEGYRGYCRGDLMSSIRLPLDEISCISSSSIPC